LSRKTCPGENGNVLIAMETLKKILWHRIPKSSAFSEPDLSMI
jgi:hypothetical protein